MSSTPATPNGKKQPKPSFEENWNAIRGLKPGDPGYLPVPQSVASTEPSKEPSVQEPATIALLSREASGDREERPTNVPGEKGFTLGANEPQPLPTLEHSQSERDLLLKSLEQEALRRRALGQSCIPVRIKATERGKEKTPTISSWLKYQTKLPSEKQIHVWFDPKTADPETDGLARLCGGPDGAEVWVFVIDLDRKDLDKGKKPGEQSLAEFEQKHGVKVPKTWTIKTPSRGKQLEFAASADLVKQITNQVKLLENVDTRSHGGYSLIPPSPGYDVVDERERTVLSESDFAPGGWVHALLNAKPAGTSASANGQSGRRVLSDETIRILVTLIGPYWQPTVRHALGLSLTGLLAKEGAGRGDAEAIITLLMTGGNDDEKKDRIGTIRDTWQKFRDGKTVRGYVGLAEALGSEELAKTIADIVTRGVQGSDTNSTAEGDSEDGTSQPPAPQVPFTAPDPLYQLYGYQIIDKAGEVQWAGGSRLLGEFVELARDLAPGLPDDWAIVSFLTGMSALVPHLRIENLGLNLWMLGIAKRSTGKGNLLDATETVMREASTKLPRDWFTDTRVSIGGLVSHRSPLRTFTSGTPLGLLHLAQHGPVLTVFEEASSFMEQADRLDNQTGIKQTFCQLYDRRRVSHQTRGKEGIVEIEQPHVAMLAAINRTDFSRVFTLQDLTSGFLSRMLIVSADYLDLAPKRLPEKSVFDALGGRLGEHLSQFKDVVYARFDKRHLTEDDLRRLNGRLVTGEDLLWSILRAVGFTSNTGGIVDLDAPEDEEDLETPRGRDIARIKKLAVAFEMLEDEPNIQTFETGDRLPAGAGIGDLYLGVRDQNILRALSLVLRCRAYAHRATNWLGTSEDQDEQRKIVNVIIKHPGISESRIMDYVRSRGAAHLKRNLEMLERSGEIRKVSVIKGRGYRYYLGDWTDERIRESGKQS